MIPLSFGIRPVGLPENRCDFLCVEIIPGRPVHLLYRDACNLTALRDRQWLATCDKGEEAVDGSQPTGAGADGLFSCLLQVLPKTDALSRFQVRQVLVAHFATLS